MIWQTDWPWMVMGAAIVVSLVAAAHVVLNKRDGPQFSGSRSSC